MFILKRWFLQIVGKKIEKQVGLVDDKGGIVDSKKWFLSKTLWSIVLNAAVGIVEIVNPGLLGTPIASTIIVLLTSLGIYSRTSANTTLTK